MEYSTSEDTQGVWGWLILGVEHIMGKMEENNLFFLMLFVLFFMSGFLCVAMSVL